MPKQSKPKPVNFRIINLNDNPEPYRILHEVRELHHGEIHRAQIALAWRLRQNADRDGHLVLGKCVKVSDLHREFADFDFIIVLNQEIWSDLSFTKSQKVALIDHELCHAAPNYDDETGEHKQDEKGRYLFRIRRHDIEEFGAVVERHGCYKRDLEAFARVLLEKRKAPLFEPKPTPSRQPSVN